MDEIFGANDVFLRLAAFEMALALNFVGLYRGFSISEKSQRPGHSIYPDLATSHHVFFYAKCHSKVFYTVY